MQTINEYVIIFGTDCMQERHSSIQGNIMTLSRFLVAPILALTVMATHAQAKDPASAAQIDIKRESLMRDIPDRSVADKKIFVLFEDSPKMTMIVRERLRSKGLAVTENAGEADVKYQMMGTFSVSGRGREPKSRSMGELLEASMPTAESLKADYYHQTTGLDHVALDAVISKPIAITDLSIWLSEKTGVAGRFNEMVTGNAQGWCFTPDCNKLTSFATVIVRGGDDDYWWLQASAVDDKVVLDVVVADILENSVRPFDDLGSAKTTQKVADGAVMD